MQGGDGDDYMITNGVGASFDGGAGTDTADYRDAAAGVTISLALLAGGTGSAPNGATLVNVEHLAGSSHADTIDGSDQANNLTGFAGDDVINGHGGNDRIFGESGNDVMSGGLGDDEAIVSPASYRPSPSS